MRRKAGWPFGLASVLVVASLGGWDRPAGASGISTTWSGASASTSYDNASDSRQGATASAASSGQATLTVLPSGYDIILPSGVRQDPDPLLIGTAGSVGASASNDPAHLLQVTASNNAGNPGSNYVLESRNDTGTASASWSNDAVLVKAPAGSSLPDAIRLNFTLTFTTPGTLPYASLTATYNGQQDSVNSTYGTTFAHIDASGMTTGLKPASVDTTNANGGTNFPGDYPAGGLKDTFHIDLPLDKNGLSAPFNLSLALNPPMGISRDEPTIYTGLTGNLSLDSVTLPDGSSLASLGDAISFESGLSSPHPVPEPASLLAWTLALAIVGSATARVRRLRPGPA